MAMASVSTFDVSGRQAVVIGAGVSGLAAVRLLRRQGARVRLNDRSPSLAPAVAAELGELDVETVLGGHPAEAFRDAALIVVSPGVPDLPVFASLDVEIIGEAELAYRFLRGARFVGITGTNGKSTVTTLVGSIAGQGEGPVFVGGNLGRPMCDLPGDVADGPGGTVVAELSSFQLERVRDLKPDVGVLLPVTPDHLDRYPSFAAYAEAKGHLFDRQGPRDHAVIPHGDPLTAQLAARGRGEVHTFGAEGEAVVAGEALRLPGGFAYDFSRFPLGGTHNRYNAAAAALAARLAGASDAAIEAGLSSARALPHRAAAVRELEGVVYVDDSKATNVAAAVASLEGWAGASRRAVLIAGGVDKGGSYAPLAERLAGVGRAAVLLGEAAPLLREAFAHLDVPLVDASDMGDAVGKARSLAAPGDVVLLAPACSSFDAFRSYAHRGDAFVAAVRALPEEDG
jgi:UDP-N-acetylmuramoylalanine--D-glutamate ligase